jgi:cholesterol oxidase
MSCGERAPTSIPKANGFARAIAALTGGVTVSMVTEILFDVPATARHRLFGYQNAYVVDVSVISANLGVNPSLTIASLAQRAISFIPPDRESRLTQDSD